MTNPSAQFQLNGGSHAVTMETNIKPLILVSRDTIHLGLQNFRSRMQLIYQAASSGTLCLSVISVLLTAETFNDFVISGSRWRSIYEVAAVLFGAWFAVSLVRILLDRNRLSVVYALQEICGSKQADVHMTLTTPANPTYDSVPLKNQK